MTETPLRGVLTRRLSVFLSLVVMLLLSVAAGSLVLARTISQRGERIQAENSHIRLTDEIRSTAHHLILETYLFLLSPGQAPSDRPAQVAAEVRRLLAEYRASHRLTGNSTEGRQELTLMGEVEGLAADLMEVTTRLVAVPRLGGPEKAATLARMETISRTIPNTVTRLNALHLQRADSLIQQSWRDLIMILGISVSVALLTAVAVVAAHRYAKERVALPLQALASAAGKIAAGDFSQRTTVKSRDEIRQLAEAFNIMAGQLQAHQRQIQDLATVAERERLAREMHDGLAQALALICMRLPSLEEAVGRDDAPASQAIARELRDIATRALQEVRQAIFDLRVMVSRNLGLVPTLTEYLHEFSADSGIRADFSADGGEFQFAPDVELQLMRILQEALTNVRRHTRASYVTVRLQRVGDAARLIIRDDGCGFDPGRSGAEGRAHFGLTTMRERAEAVGGKFCMESQPGQGTTVEVVLPLPPPEG